MKNGAVVCNLWDAARSPFYIAEEGSAGLRKAEYERRKKTRRMNRKGGSGHVKA